MTFATVGFFFSNAMGGYTTITMSVHSFKVGMYWGDSVAHSSGYFCNNNNSNVHLSYTHQHPECSHDTY